MTSNFDFTDKTQQTLANAIQCAKDYSHAQGMYRSVDLVASTNASFSVHPAHLAFSLLNEDGSLLASVIEKAGGEPSIVKRALQKTIVRLPSQSPPPDDTTLSSASLKVLREAQSIQKTMHDSYIAQDHILLALLKDSTISSILKEASLTEATLKTAIEQTRGNRRVESKTAEEGFDARK